MKALFYKRALKTLCCTLLIAAQSSYSMQQPSAEEWRDYQKNGSLSNQRAMAKALNNHTINPNFLLDTKQARSGLSSQNQRQSSSLPELPSIGDINVLALLIELEDQPHTTDTADIHNSLFGTGNSYRYPYESLRQFYKRSSYDKLRLQGQTLDWYQAPYAQNEISQTTNGRENLIREALMHHQQNGFDFTPYDNDADGDVDYLMVIWSGQRGDWGSFWWAYTTNYQQNFKVDGKRINRYSWQWETPAQGHSFSPRALIHETGHALGLPDLYDYDTNQGPGGGVGHIDMMSANMGDHNGYHKWLLGWLEPSVINTGSTKKTLRNLSDSGDTVAIFPGHGGTPNQEMFFIEHRNQTLNDKKLPGDGLLIWHINGAQKNGQRQYNNSTTSRKYMRLIQADGLSEIERFSSPAEASDYFTAGDKFTNQSTPSSKNSAQKSTNVYLHQINKISDDEGISFRLGISDNRAIQNSKTICLPCIMLLLDDDPIPITGTQQ